MNNFYLSFCCRSLFLYKQFVSAIRFSFFRFDCLFLLALWPSFVDCVLCFYPHTAIIMIRLMMMMMFPHWNVTKQKENAQKTKTHASQQKRFHLYWYIFPECTFAGDFLIFLFPFSASRSADFVLHWAYNFRFQLHFLCVFRSSFSFYFIWMMYKSSSPFAPVKCSVFS